MIKKYYLYFPQRGATMPISAVTVNALEEMKKRGEFSVTGRKFVNVNDNMRHCLANFIGEQIVLCEIINSEVYQISDLMWLYQYIHDNTFRLVLDIHRHTRKVSQEKFSELLKYPTDVNFVLKIAEL